MRIFITNYVQIKNYEVKIVKDTNKKNINSLTEKDIKIGITLNVFDTPNKFFSNGINQNTLYLCEVLLNGGFEVVFIVLKYSTPC